MAVMPAAAPAAMTHMGDASIQRTAKVARAMPSKMAGKIGPPLNPQPRLTAYASPLVAVREAARRPSREPLP
jgi:hypothetical protein